MFTGIVTDIGTVRTVETRGDARLVIATSYDPETIDLGASIACSGCCLTVVEKGSDGAGPWFAVDASQETLDCTTLGSWAEGTRINLERAMKAGDEFGGHMVSGHVDGVGVIERIEEEGASKRFVFSAPDDLRRFIAPKGSVTADGTSLTVNEVEKDRFGVNIIPHTQTVTTWGLAREGQRINLEVDLIARYVARIMESA